MLKLWLLVIPMALAACGETPKEAAADRKERQAKRLAKAEAELSKVPVPRTYEIQGGQLQVIDVPVKDGSGFVDQQRCFVWRDAQFRQATLSCGQMPEVIITNPN